MPELWPFQPEVGMLETLEWKTEVLKSRTGEQRIALRSAPRQRLQMRHIFEARDAAWARLFARRNGALEVYVPDWPDSVTLATTLDSADTVISLDTTIMDIRVDGEIIFWENEFSYVQATIDSFNDTTVTLTAPLGADLSNPTVAPVRTALLTDGMKFTRGTLVTDASVEFLITDNADLQPDAPVYQQYLSLDIMTDRPVLMDDISASVIRSVEYVDNGFGPIVAETVLNYADFGQTLGFYVLRGAPLWEKRQWLHSLRGRQGSFWMPVFSSELIPNADIDSVATTFEIRSIAPSSFYAGQHILVELADGTFIARSIASASVVDAEYDELTLSSAFGVDVNLDDLVMICLMNLSRLNSDTIELSYDAEHVSINIPVLEVPE